MMYPLVRNLSVAPVGDEPAMLTLAYYGLRDGEIRCLAQAWAAA